MIRQCEGSNKSCSTKLNVVRSGVLDVTLGDLVNDQHDLVASKRSRAAEYL